MNRLTDIFPGSEHVDSLGMGSATDREVWDYAAKNGHAIVSKDADFSDMSVLLGSPPKIVWIQVGNCATSEIEELLRNNQCAIRDLELDTQLRVLRVRQVG